MMLTYHGAHGKLKLFYLEDGGFNHQRDYKTSSRFAVDKDTDLTSFFAKDGMLKQLTKNIFERVLKAEMEEHLGYSSMVG